MAPPPPPRPWPSPPVAPAFTLTSPSESSNGGPVVTATVSSKAAARPMMPPPLPGSFSARAPMRPPRLPPLVVTVSDPQRTGGGGGDSSAAAAASASSLVPLLLAAAPHLSYRVAGESSLPGFFRAGATAAAGAPSSSPSGRCAFSVRRRFSDFEALRALLLQRYRGYVVPPLPEKAFLDAKVAALTAPVATGAPEGGEAAAANGAKSPSSFVAVRTADLAAFMRGLAEHPVLRRSAELRVFLTHAEGSEGAWKEAAMAAEAPSAASSAAAAAVSSSQPPSPHTPPPPQSAWRSAPLPAGGGGGVLALRCKHSLLNAAASIATAASSAAAVAAAATATAGRQQQRRQQQPPPTTTAPAPAFSSLPPIPLPEDERALRAAREAAADLEHLLGGAVAASRALVGRMAALAADFGALAGSLAAFSRWEEKTARRRAGQYTPEGARGLERATTLQTAALGGGRAEALLRAGAVRAAAALVGLHDQLALVPETAAALERRERAADDLLVLEAEVRARLQQLQRAREAEAEAPFVAASITAAAAEGSAPKTREARRVAAARAAFDAAEARAATLRVAHAEEARRNRAELERLSARRSIAQRNALAGLAKSQRELAAALGELWGSIEAQMLMHGRGDGEEDEGEDGQGEEEL